MEYTPTPLTEELINKYEPLLDQIIEIAASDSHGRLQDTIANFSGNLMLNRQAIDVLFAIAITRLVYDYND